MKKLFLFFFISSLALSFIFISKSIHKKTYKQNDIKGITAEVNVSAFIGKGTRFSLFGYSSPKAIIKLEGLSLLAETLANKKGYFEFTNEFAPLAKQEVCLTAQDQLGRISPPVCLPPFPNDYNTSIGPVIMPPTVSLDKPDYFVGDQVILSGQSVPNSSLDINFFTEKKSGLFAFSANIVKEAYAFSLPPVNSKTDDRGNFSLSLPSSSSQKYRLFTTTNFEKYASPQSINLTFSILPVWMIIIKIFMLLISLLRPYLSWLLIIFQLTLLFVYFLRTFFHPYRIFQTKALMVRENYDIVVEKPSAIVPFASPPLPACRES